MAVFQDMVTIINLAPKPLSVMFDGQQHQIPLGESRIPAICLEFAKNQNPVMGSANPDNPHMSGCRYLISEKGNPEERQEPFDEDEWNEHLGKPCRMNTDDLVVANLGKGERVILRGKPGGVQAKSLFENGVKIAGTNTMGSR